MRLNDLTGQRFGRLVVIGRAAGPKGRTNWLIHCDCGVEKSCLGERLVLGKTNSCGCLRKELSAAQGVKNAIHGHTRNWPTKTPTYKSWDAMKRRCLTPGNKDYAKYGGAGITVCEHWKDFQNFLADMGERPIGKTLDRFPDPAGNYKPSNTRWASPLEQRLNRVM